MDQAHTRQSVPVAVIIPCYNYGRFISRTIESMLAQTMNPAELIVVDDGSTDDTRDVCARYPQVRYIWKENGGVSTARNLGLRESTAEYVMFPDADDMVCPTGLQSLWEAKQKCSPEVKAFFGRAEFFADRTGEAGNAGSCLPSPEEIAPYVLEEVSPDMWILSDRILGRIVESNIVAQCAAVIARAVYEDIGWWDHSFRYHQDRDIWLRIASRFPICFVNRPVARVRKHDDNITHSRNWMRNHTEILELLDKATHATWASARLRRLARRRWASGAYLLAQRVATTGDLGRAAELMRAALRRRPLWPKPLIRMTQYSLKRLLSFHAGDNT